MAVCKAELKHLNRRDLAEFPIWEGSGSLLNRNSLYCCLMHDSPINLPLASMQLLELGIRMFPISETNTSLFNNARDCYEAVELNRVAPSNSKNIRHQARKKVISSIYFCGIWKLRALISTYKEESYLSYMTVCLHMYHLQCARFHRKHIIFFYLISVVSLWSCMYLWLKVMQPRKSVQWKGSCERLGHLNAVFTNGPSTYQARCHVLNRTLT